MGSNPISHPPNKPRTEVRGFLFGKKPTPSPRLERKALPKKKAPPPQRGEGKLVGVGLPPRHSCAAASPPAQTSHRSLDISEASHGKPPCFQIWHCRYVLEIKQLSAYRIQGISNLRCCPECSVIRIPSAMFISETGTHSRETRGVCAAGRQGNWHLWNSTPVAKVHSGLFIHPKSDFKF